MEPTTTPTTDTPTEEATAVAPPENTPPTEAPAEVETQTAAPDEQASEATEQTAQPPTSTDAPTEDGDDDEEEALTYQAPTPVPPIDFSQLPADENGLIDPNQLAGAINQRIAQAEQNAVAQAQRMYAENEQEKRLWDKAYSKYPDLKNDKELHNLVHQARIGEATDLLSRSNDPNSVKLPTPAQVADKLFKRIGSAKSAGMQQATTNTVVQKSAQLETAGRTSNDAADSLTQARSNLKNPNAQVRTEAANKLLRNFLGWE